MKLVLRSAIVLLLLLGGTSARAQDVGDVRRGLDYAKKTCAACHAVLQSDLVSPVPEATPLQIVANTPGMTGTALSVWLNTPHPTMPNLIVPTQDRYDLIAYVLSLAKR